MYSKIAVISQPPCNRGCVHRQFKYSDFLDVIDGVVLSTYYIIAFSMLIVWCDDLLQELCSGDVSPRVLRNIICFRSCAELLRSRRECVKQVCATSNDIKNEWYY